MKEREYSMPLARPPPVLDGDRLDRTARSEAPGAEPGEGGAVGGGPLGEDEDLRPGQRGQRTLRDLRGGLQAALLISPDIVMIMN